MLDFFIGFEKDNPSRLFFYKPIKLSTNLLTIELLDNYNLQADKEYQFYFNIDGTNFAFLGKPIKIERNKAIFLIKDSAIELRRYPRVTVKEKSIKVKVDYFLGWLIDISLGGCRIGFDTPLPRAFYSYNPIKTLKFFIPPSKEIKIRAKLINILNDYKEAAFVFDSDSSLRVKLYNEIIKYLNDRNLNTR
jgi:hypothetical protein